VTPGSQDVQVGNPAGQAISFQSGMIGNGLQAFLPTNASVQPGQPTTVRVFPDFSNLTAGEHPSRGRSRCSSRTGRRRQTINVLIVVAPAGSTAATADAYDSGDGSAERGYRIKLTPEAPPGARAGVECAVPILAAEFQCGGGPSHGGGGTGSGWFCGILVGPGGQSAYVAATMSNGDPLIAMDARGPHTSGAKTGGENFFFFWAK